MYYQTFTASYDLTLMMTNPVTNFDLDNFSPEYREISQSDEDPNELKPVYVPNTIKNMMHRHKPD